MAFCTKKNHFHGDSTSTPIRLWDLYINDACKLQTEGAVTIYLYIDLKIPLFYSGQLKCTSMKYVAMKSRTTVESDVSKLLCRVV